MCVASIVVQDLSTKAKTEFAGTRQWLGASSPAGAGKESSNGLHSSAHSSLARQSGGALSGAPVTVSGTQLLRLLPAGQAGLTIFAR